MDESRVLKATPKLQPNQRKLLREVKEWLDRVEKVVIDHPSISWKRIVEEATKDVREYIPRELILEHESFGTFSLYITDSLRSVGGHTQYLRNFVEEVRHSHNPHYHLITANNYLDNIRKDANELNSFREAAYYDTISPPEKAMIMQAYSTMWRDIKETIKKDLVMSLGGTLIDKIALNRVNLKTSTAADLAGHMQELIPPAQGVRISPKPLDFRGTETNIAPVWKPRDKNWKRGDNDNNSHNNKSYKDDKGDAKSTKPRKQWNKGSKRPRSNQKDGGQPLKEGGSSKVDKEEQPSKKSRNDKGELLCWICSKTGHISKDCPKSNRNNNKDDCMSSFLVNTVISYVHNNKDRCIFVLFIKSNSNKLIKSRILADSGSDLNLISATFAETLGLRKRILDVPYTVDGFTPGSSVVMEMMEIEIVINNYYINLCPYLSDSLVFKKTDTVLILGNQSIGKGKPFQLCLPYDKDPELTVSSCEWTSEQSVITDVTPMVASVMNLRRGGVRLQIKHGTSSDNQIW